MTRLDAKNYFTFSKSRTAAHQFRVMRRGGGRYGGTRFSGSRDYQVHQALAGAENRPGVTYLRQTTPIRVNFDPCLLWRRTAPVQATWRHDPTTTNCVPAGSYWAQCFRQRLVTPWRPQDAAMTSRNSYPAGTSSLQGCKPRGAIFPVDIPSPRNGAP